MKQSLQCQSYEILVGDAWPDFTSWIRSRGYSSVVILVDENTRQYCLPLFQDQTGMKDLKILEIKSGENEKNIQTCLGIWQKLIEYDLDRYSLLINLGGGVIGDMGGFCAGTFMRGIDFAQIPTTLLSQVDASVGSKLGIDFNNYKNLIGLFKDPVKVLINPVFLKTLPPEELQSGFAEIVKHALIRDPDMWNEITSLRQINHSNWENLIFRNIVIKKDVVDSDMYESGLRKILNFGHTIGHAIEASYMKRHDKLTHGQAIAAGMVCESFIAREQLNLPEQDFHSIVRLILRLFDLPGKLSNHRENILHFIRYDKKNIHQKWMFSLIDKIGHCRYNIPVDPSLVDQSFQYYDQLQNKH